MNKDGVNQALSNIRPCTILVSDGRSVYVDNPETVLLSDTVLVVGTHAQGRVVKELYHRPRPHHWHRTRQAQTASKSRLKKRGK